MLLQMLEGVQVYDHGVRWEAPDALSARSTGHDADDAAAWMSCSLTSHGQLGQLYIRLGMCLKKQKN